MRINPLLFLILLFALPARFAVSQDTLTVEQAVRTAIENNFDITLARKDSELANLSNTPGAAGMLPALNLTGTRSMSVNNTYQQYFDGREKESPDARSNTISAGAALTWTLFDGFDMFISKKKLNELENLSSIQLQAIVENTVADVIQAYYTIITQQKMVDVYREAMAISSERKRIAQAGVTFGTSSELSYLQASVDYNADSSAYIQQTRILQNSRIEMNRLLCRDLYEPFELTQSIPVNNSLLFEKLWQDVQEQNPEIRRARTSLSIAMLDRKSANSTLYPRLNLTSGYNYRKQESEVGVTQMDRFRGFNAGLNASYSIFNGFNNRQERSMAQVRLESARIEAEQAELNVKALLQRIYNDYQANLQLAAFEEENVRLAIRNLSIAREKYRIGSANDIELRETQQKLMDAENRYLTAQYRSKATETELLRMSGRVASFGR